MEESKRSFQDIFLERKQNDVAGFYKHGAIQKAYFIGAYARAVVQSSYYSKVSKKNETFKNWLSGQIINFRNLDRIFEMGFRFEQKLKLNIGNNSEVRKLAHETPTATAKGISSAKISFAFVSGYDDYAKFTKTSKIIENQESKTSEEQNNGK